MTSKPHIARYFRGKRFGWHWGVWTSRSRFIKRPLEPVYHSQHKEAAFRNAKFSHDIKAEKTTP